MTEKNSGGRPTTITSEVILKLEHAFSMGCTDREACLYAGITESPFYSFQEKNPAFQQRKAILKETPILLARQEVIRGLKGNPDHALRFLERRKKDEFSLHQNLNISGSVDLTHHVKKAVEMTDDELMAALSQKKT